MEFRFKGIKVRLYPTAKQKQVLDSHFNAYRFCYNLCLEYRSIMWRLYRIQVSGFDMQKELREIRNKTKWLSDCKAECVLNSSLVVEKSFLSLFNGGGYPRFKNKFGKQSFVDRDIHSLTDGKIKFRKQLIKIETSQEYITQLSSGSIDKITFSKDFCGNYFASCLIKVSTLKTLPLANSVIDIDLGLTDLAITSDGVKYANNRYLKNTHFKIAKLQRKFSRTQKGSSNRNKLRIKIAKLHCKATRQREHYYHQITNELIRDNQTIVLESLRIRNMVKNAKLSRSISDVSWGLFTTMLEYKANWYGRQIIRLDTFYPSTKTCSSCGNVKDMPLSERTYNCNCGLSLDRDINAAINIRNSGLKIPGVLMEGVGYEPVEVRSN